MDGNLIHQLPRLSSLSCLKFLETFLRPQHHAANNITLVFACSSPNNAEPDETYLLGVEGFQREDHRLKVDSMG